MNIDPDEWLNLVPYQQEISAEAHLTPLGGVIVQVLNLERGELRLTQLGPPPPSADDDPRGTGG